MPEDNPFSYDAVMGRPYRGEPEAEEREPRGTQAPSAPDNPYSYESVMGKAYKGPSDTELLGPDVAGALAGSMPQDLAEGAAPAPKAPKNAGRGWFDTLTSSIHRGAGELALVPETLGAVASEAMGDTETSYHMMENVEAKKKALPQAEWDLSKVHDLGDFGYWLTERFGENAPALITMLGTGGAGGVLSVLGRSGLSVAAKEALIKGGQMVGTYAAAAPLSIAGVAQEQYGATGSTQPGVSLLAGAGGAALQTYLPFRFLRHDLGPGFWSSIGKGAVIGTVFGTGQEAVNIMARKYTDPDYEFGSDGPTRLGWGARLGEAVATQAALGGMMGPLGRTRGGTPGGTGGRFRPEAEVPGFEPGTRGELPPEGPPQPGVLHSTDTLVPGEPPEGGPGGPPPPTPPPGAEPQLPSMEMAAKDMDLLSGKMPPDYEWQDEGRRYRLLKRLGVPEEEAERESRPDPQDVFFSIQRNGEEIGRAYTTIMGRIAYISSLRIGEQRMGTRTRQPESMTPREVITLLQKVKEQYPEVTSVIGDRVGRFIRGVREAGRTTGTDPQRINIPVPKDKEEEPGPGMVPTERGPWSAQPVPPGVNFDISHSKGSRQANVDITHNGQSIGHAYVRIYPEEGKIQLGNIALEDEWQRKGIMTALQERLERQFRMPAKPDYTLSDAERGRWKKMDPAAVANHLNRGGMWTEAFGLGRMLREEREGPQDTPRQKAVREWLEQNPPGTEPGTPEQQQTRGMWDRLKDRMMRLGGPRAAIPERVPRVPEAPPEVTGATAPEPGPVTQMRRQLIQIPIDPDRGIIESTMGINGDAFGAGPMLRATVDRMYENERLLDLLEQNTPRYALEDPNYPSGYHPRLLTATELERTGLERAQAEEPRTWEIDQNSMQMAGISADVTDLPPANSERIWFLRGTRPEEKLQLLQEYQALQQTSENQAVRPLRDEAGAREYRGALEPIYHDLVTRGLRVMPSHGASFYYDGTFQGRRVTVRDTQRSRQVTFMDRDSGALITPDLFFNNVTSVFAPTGGSIPVALDLAKMKPGEVTAVPGVDGKVTFADPNKIKFDPRLSPNERTLLGQEMSEAVLSARDLSPVGSVAALADRLRGLMRRGVWIEPDANSVYLVTKEVPTLDKMTPGVYRWEDRVQIYDPKFNDRPSQVYRTPDAGFINPDHIPVAQRIVLEGSKAMPLVDSLLERLGIQGKIDLEVREGDIDYYKVAMDPSNPQQMFNPGTAQMDQGVIRLFASGFRTLQALGIGMGGFRSRLYSILMHEVGHFVTFRMVSRAPLEVQALLQYGYEKFLMDHRLDPGAARIRGEPLQAPDMPLKVPPSYYLTYPEWLAEQFRRWSGSDKLPKTELERNMKKMADDLERFYAQWERAFPDTYGARDMLEPSWFFSAAMHYYRLFGDRSPGSTMRQLLASQTLSMIPRDVESSPTTDALLNAGPRQALREMAHMFPPGVRAVINQMLNPAWGKSTEGALGRTLPAWVGQWTHPLIELATGSLPRALDVKYSRQFWAHELVHTHRMLGLFGSGEWRLLVNAAREAGMVVEAADASNLRKRVEDAGDAYGWDRATRDRLYENARQEETVAKYIEAFANNEPLPKSPAQGSAKLFVDFMTRIGNLLRGQGFNTREDVLRSFFKGEMAHREQRAQERALISNMAEDPTIVPQSIKTVAGLPGITVATQEYQFGPDSNPRHLFKFYDNERGNVKSAKDLVKAKLLGWVTLEQEEKGLHISYIKSTGDKFFMMKTMLQHIERELGESALPASEFTDQGYKMARIQHRDQLKHYVWNKDTERWMSPNFIRAQLEKAKSDMEDAYGSRMRLTVQRRVVQYWQNLYDKVPKETWRNPVLDQMFMMPRELMRDEVQDSVGQSGRDANESQMISSMGSSSPAGPTDPFTAANQRVHEESQAKNARMLGVPYSQGAPQMPSMEMRRIDNWFVNNVRAGVERVTGFREGPEVRNELTGLVNNADRIGHFSKFWWDIQQLLWNNEHVMGLRTYVDGSKMWSKFVQRWQSRAENGVRNWDDLPIEGRNRVGRLMFWESEMQYRTPNEVMNGVRRHPTTAELRGQMARENFTAEEAQVYNQIKGDFHDYLAAAERETIALHRQRITNPTQLANAIAQTRLEYNQLREKPYFPHTRFGRWTITVRDLSQPNQPVIESYAYDTRALRDQALDGVRGANPGQRITYGTAPDNVGEFMGLPGPLLREIKTNMPGLTRGQLDWIEEFEHLHAPDRTFRRRWLPQNSMPGYSLDAMRAYSSFFISGANYLARLVHAPILEQGIQEVRDSLRTQQLSNIAKRQEILGYMERHYAYMSEPGRDWGKTKAFISMWQLGFSPAAAFTNLLQTPVTTLPHLMGYFGNVAGFRYMSRAVSERDAAMPGQFALARGLMADEGLINIGQAADLAMYAQGNNMARSLAGSASELAWRSASYYGMWMFQKAEEMNRNVTARAAWLGAMENPNHARVQEVAMLYPREMGELTGHGLTHEEAAAYLFTKETIEATQGNYTKWNRSPFLRSQLGQVALIFFKYTQNMIELYRLSPGRLQMAMIQAALFGLAGLPGAEDINQVLRSVGHTGVWLLRKLGINYFGKDFDLFDKAREYAREFTKGTPFDKTGPDLLLHGISRYGFGLGLLPEGMALGQFDASANGSLGKVVPGLQEGLRGLMFGDYKTGVSDVAARAAGAGYGWLFTMMKYMSEDPGTFDSKTWEGLLPRVGRQMARAYRFADHGLTTRQGGQLVKFNMSDPEDIGAIAAQLAGYTPTKVSQVQEAQRDMIDRQALLKIQKTMIYGQLDKAIERGDPRVIADVMKAVNDYNEQVVPEDPTQAIQIKGLITSLKRRQQQRAYQSALQQPGAVNKATIPMYQKILENYPGIVDSRKVQGGG